MTIQELVQNAENSHQAGVPVDWHTLCIKVVNAANQTVLELEGQLAALRSAEEEVDDGDKDPEV